MKKNVAGLHVARQRLRAMANFRVIRGAEQTRRRKAEIAALPLVMWKGAALRTITCRGTGMFDDVPRGRGPHQVNVPESLLWSLMQLDRYHCPFHQ